MRFQRELTAAILIPLVLLLLIKGTTWMWALLVAAATGVALLEFYGLLLAAGCTVPRVAGFLLFFGFLAAAELREITILLSLVAAILVVVPTLVMFAKPPEATLLPSSAGTAFATLYVAFGGGAVIALRAIGWKPVLFLLAVVWAGDSAAYYVGKNFGKRKLAPVVSPKKTWEGFWGQIAGGALLGLASYFLTSSFTAALLTAATGAVVSVAAVVGDLVESTFKRSCAVKDSGGLLPGHGGLLDRLDSLLYASPVVLLIANLFPAAIPR